MVPTLAGRIQTALALLAVVGGWSPRSSSRCCPSPGRWLPSIRTPS